MVEELIIRKGWLVYIQCLFILWTGNSWAQSHSGNALLLSVQQEEGSWASSLGCSAPTGYPEGWGWTPGGLAPLFYSSGCSKSNPANANGEWGAGCCGREGALRWVFGAHQEELLVGISQASSSPSLRIGGGDFLFLTSMKGQEGIQSVALNSWAKNWVTLFVSQKSVEKVLIHYHPSCRVDLHCTVYCKADRISPQCVSLAYTCVTLLHI